MSILFFILKNRYKNSILTYIFFKTGDLLFPQGGALSCVVSGLQPDQNVFISLKG
jgi:hypothetical protein